MTPYERRMLARARAQNIINQNRSNGNRAQSYKAVGEGDASGQSDGNESSSNVLLRGLATYGDINGDVLTGLVKGLEGIVDLGIGLVGGIGGFFNDDFEENMKNAVEYDFTGRAIGDHLDELFKDSYTNEGKLGEIVEGIASGVGQMLPAIAITAATAGAGAPAAISQAAGLITTGVSAAGNAAEEAYGMGADTWQGLGYGAAIGGIEAATEKIGGSVLGDSSKMAGTVIGDWLIKNGKDQLVRKGVGKLAYNFASEGLEEVISDIAAPIAQSTFDVGSAREDYFGENAAAGWSEIAKGLPTTFVIGGGTGAVMQGIQSGISNIKNRDKGGSRYTSVVSDMTTIEDVMEAGEAVKRSSKATQTQVDEFETRVNERILDRIQNISYNIKRMSESERANTFEDAPILTEFLNEDGSVIEDFSETLRARIDTGRATNTTARVSELGRVTESTRKAVEQFNKQYRATHGEDSGAVIKLYEGRFTEGERKNFAEIARSIKGISDKSGEKLNIAIIESNSPDIKAFRDGNTVFITKEELSNGEWVREYVHEIGHFAQDSSEFNALANFLAYESGTTRGARSSATVDYATADGVRFGLGENNEPRPNDRSIYINDDREYRVLAKALASKNGNKPRPVEYAYTDKNFYIVKDNRYGEFNPILQIDIETNRKLIEIITKEIDSGAYKNATTFAEWVRLVQSRERSDDSHFGRTSRRETNVRADGLYGRESQSETGRTSSQNRRNQQSPPPYLKRVYSFTDVAGVKKHVVKIDSEYFIEGDGRSDYAPSIETAVERENERVIQRYVRRYNATSSWVKGRLAEDSDFLKKERRRGLRFSLGGENNKNQSNLWVLLSKQESAQLYERIDSLHHLGYSEKRLSNGNTLIDVNNKIIETNADFDNPLIEGVVEFKTFNEKISQAEALFYEYINNGRTVRECVGIVNEICQEEIAIFHGYENSENYRQVGRQGQSNPNFGRNSGNNRNRGGNSPSSRRAVSWHFNDDGSQEITYSDGSKETRFSLKDTVTDDSDIPVIEIEIAPELTERLEKNPNISKHNIIRDYLIENFYGKTFIMSDGKEAIIDKRDALKLSYLPTPVKTAELSNIRRIIEKAPLVSEAHNVEHKKFNDFYYYRARVSFEGELFDIFVNVGKAINDGSYHIYDITPDNTKKRRAANQAPPGLSRVTKTGAIRNGSSTDIIPEKSGNVKGEDKKSFSESFINKTLDSFGIQKLGDYIHVQRQVFNTLLDEGFFTDPETRSRTDVNEESGMVIETNKSGIDETFNEDNYKQLGKFKKYAKLATVRMIPEIIKNGKLIGDNVPNQYQNSANKTFAYIAYDTELDGIPVTVKLDIKKSPVKNKLWVHSIITEKNSIGQDVSSENGTGTPYRTDANGGIIPQDSDSVKRRSKKSSDNDGALSDVFYKARESVLNAEYGVTESDVDSAWEKAQRGERLNEREQLAYDELTAKMVANVLGSRESINRIARDNSTLARRLLNKLRDQIDVLRTRGEDRANLRRLRQAELYFEEAIEDKTRREAVKATDAVRFSSEYDPDSKTRFVNIILDDIVDEGINKNDSWGRKARLYLRNKFNGIVLPLGKTKAAYIRKEGVNEYTNTAKEIDSELYRGKMLAATELDNLLSSAKYISWENDDGRHPDVLRWLSYETVFLVNDSAGKSQVLKGIVKIKRISRGDCFYDITQIRNITNGNIGQSILKYAAESVSDVSTDIISENPEKINSSNEKSSKNNSNARFSLSSNSAEDMQKGVLKSERGEKSESYLNFDVKSKQGDVNYENMDNGGNGRRSNSQYAQGKVGRSIEKRGMAQGNGAQSGNDTRGSGYPVYSEDSERVSKLDVFSKLSDTAIKDERGNPILLYHVTDKKFDTFSKGDIGFHFGTEIQAQKRAKDKYLRSPIYVKVYLNIKNPIYSIRDIMSWNALATATNFWSMDILDDVELSEIRALHQKNTDEYNSPAARRLREMLVDKGYDGIVYPNAFEGDGKSYIAFFDEQIIRDFDDKNDSKINFSLSSNDGERNRNVKPNMSDDERYNILKRRSLSLSARADYTKLNTVRQKFKITDEDIEFSKYGDRIRLFKKLGDEFSVYRKYENPDVKIDFNLSKENLKESVNKQVKNYVSLAKMLTCFNDVIENAVGIEAHNRNGQGYKADNSLSNVYVLASAFVDVENIIPVKLEIKEFSDKENTLHVAIALESINIDGIVKQEVVQKDVARQYSPPSNISIPQLFKKINLSDKSFLKYIPDGFLSEAQKRVKRQALDEDAKKSGASKINFSLSSEGGDVKKNARKTGRKVYTKEEARTIVNAALTEQIRRDNSSQVFDDWYEEVKGKLRGRSLDAVSEELWKALNKAGLGEEYSIACQMADLIMQSAVAEDSIYEAEIDEYAEIIDVFKDYIRRVDISGIRDDIRRRYGKRSPGVVSRWGARGETVGLSLNDIASDLTDFDFYIDSENPADILFEIEDAYSEAVRAITERSNRTLSKLLSPEEYRELRDKMVNDILKGYRERGSSTKLAKTIVKYQTEVSELTRELKDAKTRNTLINKALDRIKNLREVKDGAYKSCAEFQDDRFKGSIERLTVIESRGTLKDTKIREILQKLKGWYTEENKLFSSGGARFSTDVADFIEAIADGEGDLTNDELDMLVTVVGHLTSTVNNYNKIWRRGKYVNAIPVAQRYVDVIKQVNSAPTSMMSRIMRSGYMQSFADPASLMKAADGYIEGGFYTDTYEELRRGAIDAAVTESELLRKYNEFFKKHKKYRDRLEKHTIRLENTIYGEEDQNGREENGDLRVRRWRHGAHDGGSGSEFGTENRKNERIFSVQRSRPDGSGKGLSISDNEGRGISSEIFDKIRDTSVVDENGNPIAVYHYTPNMEFNQISKSDDIGFHSGTIEQAKGKARGNNGRVFRSYYNIKKPLNVRSDIGSWKSRMLLLYLETEEYLTSSEISEIKALMVDDKIQSYNSPASVRLREILKSYGYDGIVYPNGVEGDGDAYIAFDREQIITTEILEFKNGELLYDTDRESFEAHTIMLENTIYGEEDQNGREERKVETHRETKRGSFEIGRGTSTQNENGSGIQSVVGKTNGKIGGGLGSFGRSLGLSGKSIFIEDEENQNGREENGDLRVYGRRYGADDGRGGAGNGAKNRGGESIRSFQRSRQGGSGSGSSVSDSEGWRVSSEISEKLSHSTIFIEDEENQNGREENGDVRVYGWRYGADDGGSGAGNGAENRGVEGISSVQRSRQGGRGSGSSVLDSEGWGVSSEISEKLNYSKVVDFDGKPLALYHYTPNTEFTEISRSQDIGFHSGTIEQAKGRSNGKNGRIFRNYYNIKNPLRIRTDIGCWKAKAIAFRLQSENYISESEYAEIKALTIEDRVQDYNSPASARLREILKSYGYDGIVYPNGVEGDGDAYIAFDKEQIITTEILELKNGELLYDTDRESFEAHTIKLKNSVYGEENQNGREENGDLRVRGQKYGTNDGRNGTRSGAEDRSHEGISSVQRSRPDGSGRGFSISDSEGRGVSPEISEKLSHSTIFIEDEENQNGREEADGYYRGAERRAAESESATRGTNENRSGIQRDGRETSKAVGGTLRTVWGSLGLSDKIPFDSSDIVPIHKDSVLYEPQQRLINEYGIECYVVKESTWKKSEREAPAGAYKGRVYISEDFSGDLVTTVALHEATHTMKQLKYKPYLDFLDRTPEMIDFSAPRIEDLLDSISKHTGINYLSMTKSQINYLYDEVNAAVYGFYKSDLFESAGYSDWFPELFKDFDSYISELDAIHEQFKKDNAERLNNIYGEENQNGNLDNDSNGRRYYKKYSEKELQQSVGNISMAYRDGNQIGDEQGRGGERILYKDSEGISVSSHIGREIPLNLAISLYMTSKREQAWRGLVNSGFKMLIDDKLVGFGNLLLNERTADEEEIRRLAIELADEIYNQFSAEDREFVRIMEDVLNDDCAKLKTDTDMIRLGFSNVESGRYYYPVVRADVAKNIDTESFMQAMDRVSNLSMNKNLVKNASAALMILPATEVFERHVRQASMYAHLAIPTDNFNRIFNLNVGEKYRVKTVESESKITVSGRAANDYLFKLKKDIEGAPSVAQDQKLYNNVVRKMRGGYAKYQLGANPKVLCSQLSSLIASTNILDIDSIARSFKIRHKKADVDEYCALARLRKEDNTAARAQSVTEKTAGKVGDLLMKPIGGLDRAVIIHLWGACQAQIEKNGGAKIGAEENKEAAGKLLERVILETQQNALPTERSGAMRSGDELWRSLTMFSADSMKSTGRVVDALGEVSVLRKRLSDKTLSEEERNALEKQEKNAKARAKKSISALLATAVYMAIIAWGFRWLYRKEEEKETEEAIHDVGVDAVGNLFGGLPIVRDVYSYFLEGYEFDNFFLASINDLLDATSETTKLATAAASGEDVTSREVASTVRKAFYSTGQLFGIPTRNVYNFISGMTARISPESGYRLDNVFYAQSYRADLERAIEEGDEEMISVVASLMLDEKTGGVLNDAERGELTSLIGKGYDVLPSVIRAEFSYNGETVTLTDAQTDAADDYYHGETGEAITRLASLSGYKRADDKVKAKAVNTVYNFYYKAAIERSLGIKVRSKQSLFAEVADMANLALTIAYASTLEADKDDNGRSVSGSKKRKLQSYVNALNVSAAQKYIIMGYLGYSNLYGENLVRAVISRSELSADEKALMLSLCGYSNALTESEQKRLVKIAS